MPPPLSANRAIFHDVLLALLGMSPAVLTETVWALAHERPPIIPNQIVVLTTLPGRDRLKKLLFESRGWGKLIEVLEHERIAIRGRLNFGAAGDHIRLIPKPDGSGDLEDIVTSEDNRHAADYIMRCLREFTEDPSTRVIASIAGGRKTTGAILTTCMSLLGRKQDRLCHVLVNPPYDSPSLKPLFLFPLPHQIHKLPKRSQKFPSSKAKIELTDIPFVRVRGWYEREHRHAPPSYMSIVRMVQGMSPEEGAYPSITIDMRAGRLWIGKTEAYLSSMEFAFFTILAERITSGELLQSWMDLEADIKRLQEEDRVHSHAAWFHDFCERRIDVKEDARKLASGIRKKLVPLIGDRAVLDCLIPSLRSKNRTAYPRAKINFKK